MYKSEFIHETYLSVVLIRKFRNALAKLRTSSHDLNIERGRYRQEERSERICNLCKVSVETEYHFVMVCTAYENLRSKYLPSKYFVNPNIHKFNILMSCQAENIIENLAKFVFHAFEERKRLLCVRT